MHRILVLMFCVVACGAAEVATNEVAAAERLFGLEFSGEKREMMLKGLEDQRKDFEEMRKRPLGNAIPPVFDFNPLPVGFKAPEGESSFVFKGKEGMELPGDREELAFYSVADLAGLIQARKISSVELTRFFLERLKRLGPKLQCVVTLTEELALEQAAQADAELAQGKYRGPLHGIPYGAKDLLDTKGIKTTWGSVPFKDRVPEEDATVIVRLREAGAVLAAKLSLGELAMGDVWFGGTTKNPWNLEQGSSGSSAGSAAAVSAGLLPFAIGSETYGSIVSPATRCGVTGLRPTYGRVSRSGAMTLSWTMDKIGPMARSVEDCALVFNAIYGSDGKDSTMMDFLFRYEARKDLKGVRIGRVAAEGEEYKATVAKLGELGAELVEVKLPEEGVGHLGFLLSVEAAAAFDELTRSGQDDQLVRQTRDAWPNVLREARFVPAVEYIQANRHRWVLVQETAKVFEKVDVICVPPFHGRALLLSNLTGHPCVVLPNGFDEKGQPRSVTFIGGLFEEGELLAVAQLYQEETGFHQKHPKIGD